MLGTERRKRTWVEGGTADREAMAESLEGVMVWCVRERDVARVWRWVW